MLSTHFTYCWTAYYTCSSKCYQMIILKNYICFHKIINAFKQDLRAFLNIVGCLGISWLPAILAVQTLFLMANYPKPYIIVRLYSLFKKLGVDLYYNGMAFVIFPNRNHKHNSRYISASVSYQDNYTKIQCVERSGDRVITFMFFAALP